MNETRVVIHSSWWQVWSALLLAVVLIVGCEQQASKSAAQQRTATGRVYVTFHPMEYLAERIAGAHVEVVNPCPSDADPAYWMPEDATLQKYQTDADLIIINGADFEKWIGKVTLPEARIVDTSASFEDEFIELEHATTHSHGPGGEHTHTGIDGHTWLDPDNAVRQAQAIQQALAQQYPDHADAFAENLEALQADLRGLGKRLEAVSEHMQGETIFANHPAWNYLARSYGWELKTFHLDPEEMPDTEQTEKVRAQLTETPAEFMLWEAEPADDVAALFEDELGLQTIIYAPGESAEAGKDYLAIMNANVDRLEAVFK